MNYRLKELSENISERMERIKNIMDIISEDRETDVSQILLYKTGKMYQKLSDIYDEIEKMRGNSNDI